MSNKIKVLFYDIETLPLGVDTFHLGKQVVRHTQLQPNRNVVEIICIQYKWAHEKKVKVLSWIGENNTADTMIKEFDNIVEQADIVIGKNSDRFDAKHINTHRLLCNLPPMPKWFFPQAREDIEKQMRRYFNLPSMSLDYISKLLGVGGKESMSFSDWTDIRNLKEVHQLATEKVPVDSLDKVCKVYYNDSMRNILCKGRNALEKMYKYGKKDVADTEIVWNKIKRYCNPKHTYGLEVTGKCFAKCVHCGSSALKKNGTSMTRQGRKQRMTCTECGGNQSEVLC